MKFIVNRTRGVSGVSVANCLHARHAARLVVCGCLVLVLGARDVGRDAGRAVARMTRTPALSAAREREDAQGARVAVDERG